MGEPDRDQGRRPLDRGRDNEAARNKVRAAEAPARRPPWVWPAIIAASVCGVLALGVVSKFIVRRGDHEALRIDDKPAPASRPANNEGNVSWEKPPAVDSTPATTTGREAPDAAFLTTPEKPVETSDLIAFYSFDDGTASDTSGQGNDGTLSFNRPNPELRGFQGGALRFDAREDNFITIPVNINPSWMPQITMGGWFNPKTANVAGTLMSQDDGQFDRTLVIDPRTKFRWSCFTGGSLPGIDRVATTMDIRCVAPRSVVRNARPRY